MIKPVILQLYVEYFRNISFEEESFNIKNPDICPIKIMTHCDAIYVLSYLCLNINMFLYNKMSTSMIFFKKMLHTNLFLAPRTTYNICITYGVVFLEYPFQRKFTGFLNCDGRIVCFSMYPLLNHYKLKHYKIGEDNYIFFK